MPFILQHEGHSRLIVGYEIDKLGKVNLLTFDSGRRLPQSLRDYAISKLPSPPEPAETAGLKRRASGILSGADGIKRCRPDSDLDSEVEIVAERNMNTLTLDDDIVITGFTSPSKRASTSASSSNSKPSVSPRNIDLKLFKLSPKALAAQKRYQILYFPMTAPLTDSERLERHAPTSTEVS
ncbi:hypothetical protein H1R20_g5730, partial [Candolleomyces eurysporus]